MRAAPDTFVPPGAAKLIFTAASVPAALWVRLHPYARRFHAARRVATVAGIAMTWRDRIRGTPEHARIPERALSVVLWMLHHRHVTFPVEIDIDSDAPLQGPLLIMARHSVATQLLARRLAEAGHGVSLVMGHPLKGRQAIGSAHPIDVISAFAPMMMRTLAHRLREGRIVFVAIDFDRPLQGTTIVAETSGGPRYVTSQPARLAVRLGIPIATCHHTVCAAVVTVVRRCQATAPQHLIEACAAVIGPPLLSARTSLEHSAPARLRRESRRASR